MTRPFGPPETPRERKGCKQNSNGKPNNWATNLFPLNSRPHNQPAQHAGVPWKSEGTSIVTKKPCSISVSPSQFAERILEILSALPPLLDCQNCGSEVLH